MNSKRILKWLGITWACLLLFSGCMALIGSDEDPSSKPTAPQTVEKTATSTPETVTGSTPTSKAKKTPEPEKSSKKPKVKSSPTVEEIPQEESIYYENCTEARNSGDAPILVGEPGYRPELDRNKDGVACEQ